MLGGIHYYALATPGLFSPCTFQNLFSKQKRRNIPGYKEIKLKLKLDISSDSREGGFNFP